MKTHLGKIIYIAIFSLLFVFLTFFLSPQVNAVQKTLRASRYVQDSTKRSLILRGVNIMNASKSDPLRLPPIDHSDIKRMRHEWGFNFVRFLIFWDALEPNPWEINDSYLDRVEEFLDLFAQEGMYVVLDMHQDVYSKVFCCDGAPAWAVIDDGLSFEKQNVWFMNYYQPAVLRAWDYFWQFKEMENNQLQEHYIGVWTEVARRFKSHPAVIGYDLMNEPFPGSQVDLLEILGSRTQSVLSPAFDQKYLGKLYQRLIDSIRKVDRDSWIFYEPRYGAPANGLPSYLPKLHDPRPGEDHLVYFPHLYSIGLEQTGVYDPKKDKSLVSWEKNRNKELAQQKAPLLIGEWGLDSKTQNVHGFMSQVVKMADRMQAGWSYWSYDPGGWGFLDKNKKEKSTIKHLVRPYPQKISGRAFEFNFDDKNKIFTMTVKTDPKIHEAHEIFLPKRFYPNGWKVRVTLDSKHWSTRWDSQRQVLFLKIKKTDRVVTVKISPK